jgi:hypothetical protein
VRTKPVMALAEIRSCDGGRCALRLRAGGCLLWADAPFRQGLTARKLTLGGRHIDACDREVMAWLATSTGISGEMLRDVVVACVERRFGISKAAHPVEGCPTTGRLTSPRKHSTPQRPWASSFVSRQSARRNPTASRRHSCAWSLGRTLSADLWHDRQSQGRDAGRRSAA